MKALLIKVFVIVLVSVALGAAFHYSFLKQTLAGEFVFHQQEGKTDTREGQMRVVTLDEAKERFDNKSALIIDARPDLLYEMGHIAGSISFPVEDYGKGSDPAKLADYRERRILIYCNGRDCPDSSNLAGLLLKDGFKDIEVFEGGWPEWQKAGYPSEKGKQS